MVDSTNLPEVDINQIATDLNGKMDRDCLNASDTGNIQMAKASMPSNTYIDLTLNASGSTYTAPADGWFYFGRTSGLSNSWIYLRNNNATNMRVEEITPVDWNYMSVYIPAKKGDIVECGYSSTGGGIKFYFIYAVGSESEAS